MEFLHDLMGKTVRVTLTDSRLVTGQLHCIDDSTNMILSDVEIFLPEKASPCQLLNCVMVNGKHIARIEQKLVDTT